MKYEKSCGAVVFSLDSNGTKCVLMIKSYPNSGCSFPKGHMEWGESERRTAVREVKEETSVNIRITERFRHSVYYSPKPGVRKEVVYFIALTEYCVPVPREGEIYCAEWVPVEKVMDRLEYQNDRSVFRHALKYSEAFTKW